MIRFKLIFNSTLLITLLFSCTNSSGDKKPSIDFKQDSLNIIKLIKSAYKWHNSRIDQIDYNVIVKDSFQVGIDTNNLKKKLKELKDTKYFSDVFLENYERIGRAVDKKLKTGKYENEINFNFQDADPWTYFQDDAGDYWNRFQISDFKITNDSAMLKWQIDSMDYKYLVKLKLIGETWKITYLNGFDYNEIFK